MQEKSNLDQEKLQENFGTKNSNNRNECVC